MTAVDRLAAILDDRPRETLGVPWSVVLTEDDARELLRLARIAHEVAPWAVGS